MGAAFVVASLLAFYAIVYAIPVDGIVIPCLRSALLIGYAAIFAFLQERLVPFKPTLVEERIGVSKIALWGGVCFAANIVLVGGAFYLLLKGFADNANHGFDIQRFRDKPVIVKAIMAFSAALSEEVAYRRILLRYLLTFRMSGYARYLMAFIISSLIFGFGHFHAGFAKCLIASVSGIVFAVFYYKKRNIWVAIIGHFLGDAFAFII